MKPFLILLFLMSSLHAQDVLFMRNGEKRPGRLVGVDDKAFRLEVPLPTQPGAAANTASVSISKNDVSHIEFAADPARDRTLESAAPGQLREIGDLWLKQLPWLDIPRSPAAHIGCVFGDLLLKTEKREDAAKALEIFRRAEASAWDDRDKMNARQGRLRAMVATGQAKDAVKEALELAEITENPAVLIEAKFILAEADDTALRKLVEDNPRWQEDIHVIPEHARLYHQSLDLYLFPYLFHGSATLPAARGLWGAARIYDFVGEKDKALECARDLVTIYPDSKYAPPAKQYMESLPKDLLAHDPEKAAREDRAKAPGAPEKPRKNPIRKKPPDEKTHGKKPSEKSQ
ncbi:MAG: hypothetical protein WC076_10105 [Terrimicrobiaceae bacterium]|jgi:tetratricopeptide (TPR) repeat protein|nr:hypothetical protein [Terrimicrobiaceae bacterium]